VTARWLGVPMRRLICALLAGLTLVGGVAYAVQAQRADGERARLRLSVAPARQDVTAGERMRFSVTVRRSGGFEGPVRLSVRGLPPGTRAIWRRNDGTRSALVPAGQDGTALTVRTSASTPAGRTRVSIRAAGGGRKARTRLVVRVARGSRSFGLAATPRRRVVVPGETATYRIRVARGTRFRRRVRMSVAALPADSRAGWSRSGAFGSRRARLWRLRTLRIRVAPDARPASARLVVAGRARLAGRWIRRFTVVVLDIRRPLPFRIDGDLGRRLYPGMSAPVDLTLTNPHRFAIRVTRLTVAAEASTTGARCGTENFAVRQYAGPYPLTLPPGGAQLSALVSDSRLWPRLGMRNLPINQDACKDAHLTLAYGGTAVR
jgi:hypothetical protein